MKRVYLDYAAAAPVLRKAERAFVRANKKYGNPSSSHEEGRVAQALLTKARKEIARLVEVKPEHLIFTSGATEANVLAIEGHVRALMREGRTPASLELVYHEGAHASVVEVMKKLAKEGVQVNTFPLLGGRVALEKLKECVTQNTALVSIEAVSPETGALHDLRRLRTALPKETLLHVDASQVPLFALCTRERLHADLLTLDAQKIGGVRGVGCLVYTAGVKLAPLVEGGGQERGLRGGTEPVSLVVSFAEALQEAQNHAPFFASRSEKLRTTLIERLHKAIPSLQVLGGSQTAPHILSLALPGLDTDYLQAVLDKKGFAVGTKSACESDSAEGGRMAFAETGEREAAAATLRISWGPTIQERDLRRFEKVLIDAIRFLDQTKLY